MPRPYIGFPASIQADILSRYQSGESANSIATAIGCHHPAVTRFLRRFGHDVRTRSQARTKYTFNHGAFTPPLSDTALYYLGLIAADGNIGEPDHASRQYRVRITLQVGDIESIQGLKDFLKYSGPIAIRKNRGYSDSAGIEIRSTKLATDLIALGCVPRKSRDLKFPDSLKLNRHLWRGYFDGNGSISLSSTGWSRLQNTTASPYVKDQFVDFCKKVAKIKPRVYHIQKSNAWHICAWGLSGFKLAHCLYGNTELAMRRKLNLAREATGVNY